MRHRAPIGYRAALDWIVRNEDTQWLTDEYSSISVTAALVADIYDRTNDEVTRDLRRVNKKFEGR